jgi:glucose dehydrogenase
MAEGRVMRVTRLRAVCLAAIPIAATGLLLAAAQSKSTIKADIWTVWGGTEHQTRYSPLNEITPTNVSQLKPVWAYVAEGANVTTSMTPIVVDGVMYVTLSTGVAALYAETGKEVWRFTAPPWTGRQSRGVSYWAGDATHAPRIVYAIFDKLYVLDATTGLPVTEFATNGVLNLRAGVADKSAADAYYQESSPPAIYKNLIIISPSIQEWGSDGPSGDPRAFDILTGKLVWRFHTVPQPGEPGHDTWGPHGWEHRAGPSAWGIKSIDRALGMVYIPIGNPTDGEYGADRPGKNLYANSVLALDAATGKLRWSFQTTHHDLYDYDLAAAPALIDVKRNSKTIPALVQVSKSGFAYILDRRTGTPIYGVEERPVAQSDVPGEVSSPTQPFPVKPGPIGRVSMTRDDISDITPEVHTYCTDLWDKLQLHNDGPFSPPSIKGLNIFLPGSNGGMNWGGVSYNPQLGYFFVNTSNETTVTRIVPDGKGGYTQQGAFGRYNDPNGYPCVKPPWGEFAAVNVNTGDIAWEVPLGNAEFYGAKGIGAGTQNIGGSVATATGLVFIGAARDGLLRVFDGKTGKIVWSTKLPGQGGSPMSFQGKSGRQYVMVAAGPGRAVQLGGPPVPNGAKAPDAGAATSAATDRARADSLLTASTSGVAMLIAYAIPRSGEQAVDLQAVAHPRAATAAATTLAPIPVRADAKLLPEGSGKDDILRTCTGCHGVDMIVSQHRNARQWSDVVTDMRNKGAQADDATAARIHSYLTQFFGPSDK